MHLIYSNYEPTVLLERSVLSNRDWPKIGYTYSLTCSQSYQNPHLLVYRWNHQVWRTHHSLPVPLTPMTRVVENYALVRAWPSTQTNRIYVRGLYKSHVKYWYVSPTSLTNQRLTPTFSVVGQCFSWFLSSYRSWFRFQLFTCVRYWRYLQFGHPSTLWYTLPRLAVLTQAKTSVGGAWWNLTSTLLYL